MDSLWKKIFYGLVTAAWESFVAYIFFSLYGGFYNTFVNFSPSLEGFFGLLAIISGIAAIITLVIAVQKTSDLSPALWYISVHFTQKDASPKTPSNPVYICDERKEAMVAYSLPAIPQWITKSLQSGKIYTKNHDGEAALKSELTLQGFRIEESKRFPPEILGVRLKADFFLFAYSPTLDKTVLQKLKEKKHNDVKVALMYPWPKKEVFPPNKRLLVKHYIKKDGQEVYEVYEGIEHDLELIDTEVISSQSYSRFPWEVSLRFWCWRYPSVLHPSKYVRRQYTIDDLLHDNQ